MTISLGFMIFAAVFIVLVFLFWRARYTHSHSTRKGWLFSYTFWEKVCIVSGCAVILLIALITINKTYDLFKVAHYDEVSGKKLTYTDIILKHYDVAGVLVGICGIIVGFLVFAVVENNNDAKNHKINRQLAALDSATKGLDKITKEIQGNLSDLNLNTGLIDRLKSISDVIEHASANDNELFILTYAPIYGQFLMYNLKMIMSGTKKPIDLSSMSQKDFYKAHVQVFDELKSKNMEELKKFCKEGEANIAILKNNWIDKKDSSRFLSFIEDKIVTKDTNILPVNKNLDQFVSKETITEPDYHKYFIHVLLGKNAVTDPARFVRETIEVDRDFIKKLNIPEERLHFMDYIPFQFFLSVPKDTSTDQKYSSLIIFTNYINIGQENAVVSFKSKSEPLTIGLRDMFKGLVKSQDQKDARHSALKNILMASVDSVKVILKCVSVPNDKRAKNFDAYREVSPVADIYAKDMIWEMMKENDIEYEKESLYIKKDDVREFLLNTETPKDRSNGYFSIGLFFNPMVEGYCTTSPLTHRLSKFCELLDRDKSPAKRIKIKALGHVDKNEDQQFREYKEIFSEEKQQDYVLFCKESRNNRCFFFYGGINFFGTEQIKVCLSAANCEIIKDALGDLKNDFVIVFHIAKYLDGVKTEIILISEREDKIITNHLEKDAEELKKLVNDVPEIKKPESKGAPKPAE